MGRLVEDLGRQARVSVRVVGDLEPVDFVDADAFLEACTASSLLVLGIEGFYVNGGEIYPVMEVIADFSQKTSYEESILEAKTFLATIDRHPGLLLEFTISKPTDA